MENKECCERALTGIHCDVHHCVYNRADCTCHASSISVGPTTACTETETLCATFRPKADGSCSSKG